MEARRLQRREFKVPRNEFIVPRCTTACPAGVDVPRYIRAVRDKRYDEAVSVLREKLPLPTVCADACFAPCEDVCAYRQLGEPIAIRAIKRAAMDKGGDAWKKNKQVASKTGKSVAVVGAGPAGLTTAYYLASKGHDVTIFDSFQAPGGTMRYGIPDYRLPRERLDRDIHEILALGVEFKGNTTIGKDLSLARLKEDYDAVFIAAGTSANIKIPLEGSEKEGVLWGLDFLNDVALEKEVEVGENVVVIGGGNVAIDVALTSRRLGAKNVQLFCLEKREEMPAHEWEIDRAEEEGIFINNSWAPKKVMGNERVTGLGLIRCTSVFDSACNFNPAYEEEISHKLDADQVILAVGQATDLSFLDKGSPIATGRGLVQVDQEGLTTNEKGVFAGGDVVNGPDSIIGAIAHGRKAAAAMDRYLGGDGNIEESLAAPEEEVFLEEFVPDVKPRNEMRLLKPWQRASGFEQVERGLADEQITAEASRCLNCDARKFEVELNVENCKECGYCAEVCGMEVFGPADFFNAKGYRPEEIKSSNWCCGCFKCYFSCPDFAIGVKEVTE